MLWRMSMFLRFSCLSRNLECKWFLRWLDSSYLRSHIGNTRWQALYWLLSMWDSRFRSVLSRWHRLSGIARHAFWHLWFPTYYCSLKHRYWDLWQFLCDRRWNRRHPDDRVCCNHIDTSLPCFTSDMWIGSGWILLQWRVSACRWSSRRWRGGLLWSGCRSGLGKWKRVCWSLWWRCRGTYFDRWRNLLFLCKLLHCSIRNILEHKLLRCMNPE